MVLHFVDAIEIVRGHEEDSIPDGGVPRYASAETAIAMRLTQKFQSHPRTTRNCSLNQFFMLSRRTYLNHDSEKIDEAQREANICTYLADEVGVPTGERQARRRLWEHRGGDCIALYIGYIADMGRVATQRRFPCGEARR